jgi:hypothetical protein
LTTRTWTPESLGMPNRQNFHLWKDMELAYEFVETYARYSISGALEVFLVELFGQRWDLACADIYEPPPISPLERYSITKSDLFSRAPAGLSLGNVDDIKLTNHFVDNFKQFATRQVTSPEPEPAGKLYGYGTDSYGTYIPLHLLWPEFKDYWGIYISENGVLSLATTLYHNLKEFQRELLSEKEAERIGSIIQIAYRVILRHQLFHFKIEQWALLLELATGGAYYLPYLEYVYLPTIYNPDDNNLEEALANCSILLSRKIQKLERDGKLQVAKIIEKDFLDPQGPNYRNYELNKGIPLMYGESKSELRYREVVNYLCNQIIQHELRPEAPLRPYYLYPPNNNFLRAEYLCPIYLVRNLPYQSGVIA